VTVQFFFAKKSSNVAVAAFVEVMEHGEKPNVSDVKYHAHFRRSVRSICGIDCESDEVLECMEAMKIVHQNAWHDLKNVIVVEDGCGEKSPTGSTSPSSVVSP
jgi:hypothetical protein